MKVTSAKLNNEPLIQILRDGDVVTHEPVKFYYTREAKDQPYPVGEHIEIPSKYRCDSASVPSFMSWLITKYAATNAGICHDYLYEMKKVDRKHCDAIFYFLCKDTIDPSASISYWFMHHVGSYGAYLGVRMYGGIFGKHKSWLKSVLLPIVTTAILGIPVAIWYFGNLINSVKSLFGG